MKNDDLLKLIRVAVNHIVSDDAPTKAFVGCKYVITVSPNPDKLSVKNLDNGEIMNIKDLNDLEISLMSLVSAICIAHDLY